MSGVLNRHCADQGHAGHQGRIPDNHLAGLHPASRDAVGVKVKVPSFDLCTNGGRMNMFSGIVLHSNNSVVDVSVAADRVMYAQWLPHELTAILQALAQYRDARVDE